MQFIHIDHKSANQTFTCSYYCHTIIVCALVRSHFHGASNLLNKATAQWCPTGTRTRHLWIATSQVRCPIALYTNSAAASSRVFNSKLIWTAQRDYKWLAYRNYMTAYQSSLGFNKRSVLSVDLVIKPASVAEILPGAVASPQRSWRCTTVNALTTFYTAH